MNPTLVVSLAAWAQAIDPVTGGAGWAGTGIVGLVLSWLLLKHLPEKDRQTKELITQFSEQLAEKDRQINALATQFGDELKAARAEEHAYRDKKDEKHRQSIELLANAQTAQVIRVTDTVAEQMRYEREQCGEQFQTLAQGLERQAAGMDKQRDINEKMAANVGLSIELIKEHMHEARGPMRKIMEGEESKSPKT